MKERAIDLENTALGIEFGSTRIKSVLLDDQNEILAAGSYEWENKLADGIWSYSIEAIWDGLRRSYQDLKNKVEREYQIKLVKIGAIGISAMQHGYMVFDKEGRQLVPFRTWRNTTTKDASEELTELFHYPIPLRWSIAHLYQAVLSEEQHVPEIVYLTTLAGYVHWKLTGKKVVGLNEASGMFPIDLNTLGFDQQREEQFDNLIRERQYPWKLADILPEIAAVGEAAGTLTREGAKMLDESGELCPDIPFCPPEGDGATGMIATNSIRPGSGNLSAGTSAFAMIVLEGALSEVHPEIDQVVTPDGHLVGMVHCNNCTSDLNAWIKLFSEFAGAIGAEVPIGEVYRVLYNKALEGRPDVGGLLAYNYYSGEHITGLKEGRPLLVRMPDSRLYLADFMRVHLYSALASIKIGMDILVKEENVRVEEIIGHGGLFKTEGAGQRIVADALNVPVRVLDTANEGGAWGMAVLASYMRNRRDNEELGHYLKHKVFVREGGHVAEPDPQNASGFEQFMMRYKKGLEIEKTAVEILEMSLSVGNK